MTRKTFKPVAAALLLSAVVASPLSQAYFAVSLPGNAMTMSGSYYADPVAAPAAQQRAAPAARPQAAGKTLAVQPAQTSAPRKPRASAGWLPAAGR